MTNLDRFKLRAWHRKEKRMFKVGKVCLEYGIVWEEECDEDSLGWDTEAVDLLQTPGLKDKNGVLIFEDDIIKYKEDVGVVVKGHGCFLIDDLGDIFLQSDDFEIIGNKYENPELITSSSINAKT